MLEKKRQIALKNILFATDFDISANQALPFAVALADRYGGCNEPEVVLEIGPVAERILSVAAEVAADIIVMGVREREFP